MTLRKLDKQCPNNDAGPCTELSVTASGKVQKPHSVVTPLDHVAVSRCTCSHAETRPAVSHLWGLRGEAYSDAGPLRDWGRAGYGAGARPVPSPDPSSDLMVDWNATGDGIADDTQVALPVLS